MSRSWATHLARIEELQSGEPDVPAILEMLVLCIEALDDRIKRLETAPHRQEGDPE